MPSKKKKYSARFPPARIKKIMQTDEDIGKVAAAVPVIISRALELFIESLILKSNEMTQSRKAKTLSTAHIKHIIESEKKFDFLRDLVASMPNMADLQQTEEDEDSQSELEIADIEPAASSTRQPRKPRQMKAVKSEETNPDPAQPTKRPRGRPKKLKSEQLPPKKRSRKKRVKEETMEDSATEDTNSKIGSGESTEDATSPAAYRSDSCELRETAIQGTSSMPFAQYDDSSSQSDTSQHAETSNSKPKQVVGSRRALIKQSRTEQQAHSPVADSEQQEGHESELRNKLLRNTKLEYDKQRSDSSPSDNQSNTLSYSEHGRGLQGSLSDIKHEESEQGNAMRGVGKHEESDQIDAYAKSVNHVSDHGDTLGRDIKQASDQEVLALDIMSASDQRESSTPDSVPSGDQRISGISGSHKSGRSTALRESNENENGPRNVLKLDQGQYEHQQNVFNQRGMAKYDGSQQAVLQQDAEYYSRLQRDLVPGTYPPGALPHPGLPPHLSPGVCPYPVPPHPGLPANVNSCSTAGVPGSFPGSATQLGGQAPCTLGTPHYSLPIPFYGSYGPAGSGLPLPPPLIPRPQSASDREENDS